MNEQRIAEAFEEGMRKRAAEYGLEKEAFLPLLANAVRFLGPAAGMIGTPMGVARLAQRKDALGKVFSFLNKGLTHSNPWVQGGTHLGTQMVTAPIINSASEAVANMIHKPEEQQYPQY
jgi:hypothetical protein